MQWLFELMKKMVKVHFKDDFQTIFKHLAHSTGGGEVVDDDMRSLLFGDYMNPEAVSFLSKLRLSVSFDCFVSCLYKHGCLGSMLGKTWVFRFHAWENMGV